MDCWQILELKATDDQRAIKRAYLARIKESRPEEDAQAFQRVRAAYETALALSESQEWQEDARPDNDLPDWLREALNEPLSAAPEEQDVTPAEVAQPVEAPQDTDTDPATGADTDSNIDTNADTNANVRPDIPDWFGAPPRHLVAQQRQQATMPASDGNSVDAALLLAACHAVWQQAQAGDMNAATETLQRQLDGDAFSHLDTRQKLAQTWAATLVEEEDWPQGLVELIFRTFDWETDARELPAALVQRYHQHMQRTLLARIATGEIVHDAIDVLAAQALLAPRIGYKRWNAAVDEKWHKRMNRALVWLAAEAPGALDAVQPHVLRWWTSPRPQESGLWFFLAIIVWGNASLWTVEWLKPHISNGWAWFGILPYVIVVSAMLGYNLARGIAWLRVQWVVRIYWPWQAWDARMAARIPYLGHWLVQRDIGPTCDLLPLGSVYAVGVFLLGSNDGWSQFRAALFIALFPTAVLWFFWRGLLEMLATSPGALLWRELENVRRQGGN